jgi:uncharacterized oxidoreductase
MSPIEKTRRTFIMQASGNTILLTGGGSGIGREMARAWADLGNVVIITGRRQDALDETAQGRADIHPFVLDVTDAGAVAKFAGEVLARFPALNVLVNNAGIMRAEDITTPRALTDAAEMIATNLMGPIALTDALVAHLSARGDGVIVNVTSGLAFVPWSQTATYSATKAAMHSYTVSLREALAGKVEVIEIIPPAVQTELTPGQSTREGYLPLAQFIAETMAQFAGGAPEPEVCVPAVRFLRDAEAEGRMNAALAALKQL